MNISQTKPASATAEPAVERASRGRQRQRLIEACISALHLYGPSRTTVEKVVRIAEMSPGIVSFYFDSKAAMLVAALDFLATEFEQKLLEPVSAIRDEPVQALELLVDLYLAPDLASPRKISVWYAFWGESTSRTEYSTLCGKKDDAFAALVRDLIERLIRREGRAELDPDGVSLGLIGALEMLWQGFAFLTEAEIDRPAAKRRCMSYLASVFPRQFRRETPAAAASLLLPGSACASPARFEREAAGWFLSAWHYVGAAAEIAEPGDYLTSDLLGERALVMRDPAGLLLAFENRCPHRPHALVHERRGHFPDGIRCAIDGADGAGLRPLESRESHGSVFVRFAAAGEPAEAPSLGLADLPPSGEPTLHDAAADWKVLAEQWLETASLRWSPPGLFVATGDGGATLLQILPVAAGKCRILRRALGASVSRLLPEWLDSAISIAESTQAGLLSRHYVPVEPEAEAVRAFRRRLAAAILPIPEEPCP